MKRTLFTILLLFLFTSISYAQERTTLDFWANTIREDLDGGSGSFTMIGGRSYLIEQDASGVIYYIGLGKIKDTIAVKLNNVDAKKYKIENGTGKFEKGIDTDSIEWDYSQNNIEVENLNDMIFFKKNGKLLARQFFSNGFYDNEGKEVNYKIKSKEKKLSLKFDKKIKESKSDSFIWIATAGNGKDAHIYSGAVLNNYGITNPLFAVGNNDYILNIQFPFWEDSIGTVSSIDSAYTDLHEDSKSGTPTLHLLRFEDFYWTEGTKDGASRADSNAITYQSFLDGGADTIHTLASPITAAHEGSYWRFDLTDFCDSTYNGVYADSGLLIKESSLDNSNWVKFDSDDDGTIQNRPRMKVFYTAAPVTAIVNTGITKAVRQGTIIGETLQNGEITKEVYP